MKQTWLLLAFLLSVSGCADNSLTENPLDDDFPFRVVVDAEEGADLPDAEDVGVEVVFADYLGDLPTVPFTVGYIITDLEGDMAGQVRVDKVVYEVEVDDCVFERELSFESSGDGSSGTISVVPDDDLDGRIPESFEVILTLPGAADSEGGFTFQLTGLETAESNVILGQPNAFAYSVLDHELAGDWYLTFQDEGEWLAFQEVFGLINPEIAALSFDEITGEAFASFEFEEMKISIPLIETETVCEDGEEEEENKEAEVEMEYGAEEGEFEGEGSHEILGDDGETEDELDFLLEASYALEGDQLTLTVVRIIDEDNFEEGEELYSGDDATFVWVKD